MNRGRREKGGGGFTRELASFCLPHLPHSAPSFTTYFSLAHAPLPPPTCRSFDALFFFRPLSQVAAHRLLAVANELDIERTAREAEELAAVTGLRAIGAAFGAGAGGGGWRGGGKPGASVDDHNGAGWAREEMRLRELKFVVGNLEELDAVQVNSSPSPKQSSHSNPATQPHPQP